jgi:hypothetical protein
METRVRITRAAILSIAVAMGALLPASASLGQDWVPVFRSNEAAPHDTLEGDGRPKATKREWFKLSAGSRANTRPYLRP